MSGGVPSADGQYVLQMAGRMGDFDGAGRQQGIGHPQASFGAKSIAIEQGNAAGSRFQRARLSQPGECFRQVSPTHLNQRHRAALLVQMRGQLLQGSHLVKPVLAGGVC